MIEPLEAIPSSDWDFRLVITGDEETDEEDEDIIDSGASRVVDSLISVAPEWKQLEVQLKEFNLTLTFFTF